MGTVHNLQVANGAAGGEQRHAQRLRVLMRATLRVRGAEPTYPITIKDISSTGARVATNLSYFVGTQVEIDLPNIGWVSGQVVRHENENTVGIRFNAIIDPSQTQAHVTGTYSRAPSGASPPIRCI